MNTSFKDYEYLVSRDMMIWKSDLADRCLGEEEYLAYWWETEIYRSLLTIAENVMSGGSNEETINDFIREVKENEKELDALYNASREELDAILAKKREAEERERKEEESFAQRWYGCPRQHFSGRYMRYVSSVDDLKAETWTEYDNKYIIKVIEDADYDYNYYARSYGHPKKTVNNRFVNIYKHGTGRNAGCVVLAKSIEIDSFRQNNILQAIADYFKIVKPSKNKLQTNPFYEVKKINKKLYCQKFGKEVVGYVAVDNDVYYHSRTKDDAICGLSKKIELLKKQEEKEKKQEEKEERTRFSASFLHEHFGFCWQGMREFVESAGLDINKVYSLKELKNAVKTADKDVVRKYTKELKAIQVI